MGSLNKINKALQKFEQENERMPSSEELSEMIDVPKDKIADTLRVSGRHVSVDAPFPIIGASLSPIKELCSASYQAPQVRLPI